MESRSYLALFLQNRRNQHAVYRIAFFVFDHMFGSSIIRAGHPPPLISSSSIRSFAQILSCVRSHSTLYHLPSALGCLDSSRFLVSAATPRTIRLNRTSGNRALLAPMDLAFAGIRHIHIHSTLRYRPPMSGCDLIEPAGTSVRKRAPLHYTPTGAR